MNREMLVDTKPGLRRAPALPEPPDLPRGETIDRMMHAWQARYTLSVSPAALMVAFYDWGLHLANAPGKQSTLVEKAVGKWVRLGDGRATSGTSRNGLEFIERQTGD